MVLPLLAALGIYLFLSLASFLFIEEDAYISFRIAENLASGHGYVFNIGGEHIELGSSALWQFLLVPLTMLPLPLDIAAKLLGITLGCGSLVLLYRLGLRLLQDPSRAILPVLATAVSVPFVLWNQCGLETALYGALILVFALTLTSDAYFRHWWLPAGLLVLARPEGLILGLAVLPALTARKQRRAVARGALAVACILILATVARVLYFHDFVPHPFYVKFTTDPTPGLVGLLNVASTHFLFLFGLPFLAACLVPRFWNRAIAHLVVLAFLLVGWSAYAAEIKPHFRHLVPALPLVSLLLVAGAAQLASLLRSGGGAATLAFGWAWVAMVALLPVVPLASWDRGPNPLHAGAIGFIRNPLGTAQAISKKMASPEASTLLDRISPSNRNLGTNYQAGVGQFIAANYPPGITVVYDQMGQTPYYAGSDKDFIDSWGLAHRAIGLHGFAARARRSTSLSLYQTVSDRVLAWLYPEEERAVPSDRAIQEVFGRKPELILINGFILGNLKNTLPHKIKQHRLLARDYEYRYVLGGLVYVYERRGLERAPLVVPEAITVAPADSWADP